MPVRFDQSLAPMIQPVMVIGQNTNQCQRASPIGTSDRMMITISQANQAKAVAITIQTKNHPARIGVTTTKRDNRGSSARAENTYCKEIRSS